MSSDDEESSDTGSELGELEISGVSGDMTTDYLQDVEMEVSGLEGEEPEEMETGLRGLEKPVEVPVEVEREVDIREESKVTDFLRLVVVALTVAGKSLNPAYLRATRTSLLELSSHELDMVLMGQIMAGTCCSEGTSSNKKTNIRERQRSFTA